MRKRILSFVLILCTLVSLFPTESKADNKSLFSGGDACTFYIRYNGNVEPITFRSPKGTDDSVSEGNIPGGFVPFYTAFNETVTKAEGLPHKYGLLATEENLGEESKGTYVLTDKGLRLCSLYAINVHSKAAMYWNLQPFSCWFQNSEAPNKKKNPYVCQVTGNFNNISASFTAKGKASKLSNSLAKLSGYCTYYRYRGMSNMAVLKIGKKDIRSDIFSEVRVNASNFVSFDDALKYLKNEDAMFKSLNKDLKDKSSKTLTLIDNVGADTMIEFLKYCSINPKKDGSEAEKFAYTVNDLKSKKQKDNSSSASKNNKEALKTDDAKEADVDTWLAAAASISNGECPKYNGHYAYDFLNYSSLTSNKNLSDLEKATVMATMQVFTEQGSKGSVEVPFKKAGSNSLANEFLDIVNVTNAITSSTASGVTLPQAEEVMQEALTNIQAVGANMTADHVTRMLTFKDRLKYIVGACGTKELDEAFSQEPLNMYYGADADFSMVMSTQGNVMSAASNGELQGQFKIENANEFIFYLETLNEMFYFYQDSIPAIVSAISNQDSSAIKQWATALASLNDAVSFLGVETLNEYWNKENPDCDNKSLASLYNEIKDQAGQLNELEGLTGENVKLQTGDALTEFFADVTYKELNQYVLHGISYSAAYIPMKTNMYDPITMSSYEQEYLDNFFYKYGFYRKALLIDKSADSAEELHTTGLKGDTRVCTLKDIINPAGEISLYMDRNFYNANDLAELLGESYDKITNNKEAEESTEQNIVEHWITKLTDNIEEVFEISFQNQVRTGGVKYYSDRLYNRIALQKDSGYIPDATVKDLTNSSEEEDSKTDDNKDNIVLSSGQINEYLEGTHYVNKNDGTGQAEVVYDDYNVLQPYAVVSAIYRDPKLFHMSQRADLDSPVFVASANVPNTESASQYEKNEIFNWLLLKNLKSMLPVGYETSLDMSAPVYMDITGNIVTESGYVVVPAAANATLFGDTYYENVFNMALPYTYGNDYSIKPDDVQESLQSTIDTAFETDYKTDCYKIKSRLINGGIVDFARISIASKEAKESVSQAFENYLTTSDNIQFKKFFNIICEVLRGAPVEDIDKDYENLNTNRELTKAGLAAAQKFEVLNEALSSNSENAVLSIPNLAFVDGFEYIALFTFKIMLLVIIIVLMITLLGDTVARKVSWRTIIKCVSVVVTTVLIVVTIPQMFDISYYQSNKLLLQNETEYIAMLNEEKRQNGVEIGVSEIKEPDTSTALYLKLDDLYVPWYDIFSNIMLSSTFKNLNEVYDTYADKSPIAHQPDVTVMNDGVYITLEQLFDSATITPLSEEGSDITLLAYNVPKETTTAAFYSPYYTVLESLVNMVNSFNKDHNWTAYTPTMQKGGKIKSMGLIKGCFEDVSFMESEGDILGFNYIYELDSLDDYSVWSAEDIAKMKKCQWYNNMPIGENMFKRVNLLSQEARKFVAKNKNLIGKISDETFLEVMALDISMKHNNLFGVNACNTIEIDKLSCDDLLRVMTGTREQVMYDSTMSYPRFVYEIGGIPAVYLAALLAVVNFILNYVKPLCTVLIIIVVYVSLFIFKICLNKKTSSIYGYAITMGLLCILNFVYALSLKICVYLPKFGMNTTACIVMDIVVQIVYAACLLKVTITAFKDWQDLGYARYQYKAAKAEVASKELLSKFKLARHLMSGRKYSESPTQMYQSNREKDNWKYYDNLTENRNRRKKKYHIG